MKNLLSLFAEIISKVFLTINKTRISFLIIILYLSILSTSFAQVVYTDITPDEKFISRDSICLDINNDGNKDLALHFLFLADGYSYRYRFSIKNDTSCSVAISNDSAMAIMKNEVIDDNLTWSTNRSTYIQYIKLAYDSDTIGNWTNIREGYLGLRLKVDNEYHYAWLRILFSETFDMWAVDYAYNQTAEGVIIAGQELPRCATSAFAKDVNDYFDGRDIEVSFTKAENESMFSEYRIIIAKANDQSATDVLLMSQLSEDKYYSIMINPEDSAFIIRQNLLETTVDKDGDPIEMFTDYKAYILNIAQSFSITGNELSVASNIINLQAYIDAVRIPKAHDAGNTNTSSDIKISFNTEISEDFLTEFRAFIVPTSDSANFNAQAAWLLSSDYYTVIPLQEDRVATLHLNENQKDISGNLLQENISYQIRIQSVPDSVFCKTSELSAPSRRFYLKEPNSFYVGQKDNKDVQWFDCDSVFAPYPFWNGTNMYHGQAIFNIDVNRDQLPDYELSGYNYTSPGGNTGTRFWLTGLRNNKVLLCDHPEHENWIDFLHDKDAISEEYNWSGGLAIIKKYAANVYGVKFDSGHLVGLYSNQEYYIGLQLMDDDIPVYAWLKMRGVEFIEYGYETIITETVDLKEEEIFRISPNPASHSIRIQSATSFADIANEITIIIKNSLGLTLDKFKLKSHSISKDISHYPPGLYFFIIQKNGAVLETHKVIIE